MRALEQSASPHCSRTPTTFCGLAAMPKCGYSSTSNMTHCLSQRAVSELQGGYQVAVVDHDNQVAIRPVAVGAQVDSRWVISDGLNPGDRVVAEGTQKVRPGMLVNPKPFTANATDR